MYRKITALAVALAATALTSTAASAAGTLKSYAFSVPTLGYAGTFSLLYDEDDTLEYLTAIDFALGGTVFEPGSVRAFDFGTDIEIGAYTYGLFKTDGPTDFLLNFRASGFSTWMSVIAGEETAQGRAYVTRTDLPSPAAVPEPGAWALMILGFGSAGAMLRRRNALAA